MNSAELGREDTKAVVRPRVECCLALLQRSGSVTVFAKLPVAPVLAKGNAGVDEQRKEARTSDQERFAGQCSREPAAESWGGPTVVVLVMGLLAKGVQRAPGIEQRDPRGERAPHLFEDGALRRERLLHADGGGAQFCDRLVPGEELLHRGKPGDRVARRQGSHTMMWIRRGPHVVEAMRGEPGSALGHPQLHVVRRVEAVNLVDLEQRR